MVIQKPEGGNRKSIQMLVIRETVRDWEIKYQKTFESNEGAEYFSLPRQGRPPMVSDEISTEIKTILHNVRVSGGAITRKAVIAIGNGVLSSSVTKWARGILKSLDWVK